MRLTQTDRTVFVVTLAVLAYLLGGTAIHPGNARQDPPRTIEPAPIPGTGPREPKPTEVSYGETYADARVLRPKRIGTTETWTGDDGRTYSLRYMGVGIREATWPEGGPPTDEEFDAWLALPDDHEFADDLDGYLESVRL